MFMGKSIKEPVKYQGVAVPIPLIDEMKTFVIEHQYRSVSAFVQDAIREKLRAENTNEHIKNSGIDIDTFIDKQIENLKEELHQEYDKLMKNNPNAKKVKKSKK